MDVLAEMNDTENREASQSTNRRKLLGAAIPGNGSFDWKQCISEVRLYDRKGQWS